MNQRTKKVLMWALYALLFLAVLTVQNMLLGRLRVFGAKLNVMPLVMVCVGLWTGHEKGGLYGLIAGVLWQMTGADDGALAIISYPLCAILSGWLCDNVFPRRIWPALILSLGALLCHEGAAFLLKYYLEGADLSLFYRVAVTALCSALVCPAVYLLAKGIGKVGEA